ncbi:FAR1-related sequence 5-like protein [Tanacetum coccineum]
MLLAYFVDGDWESFYSTWKLLEDSPTWISYLENYKQLQLVLRKYPRALSYVDEQWLNKYKEMFVSAWTDQSLNFGNHTSNRAESQHAKLKFHVSKEALDLILNELLRLDDPEFDYSMCGCRLRNSCGLPCACARPSQSDSHETIVVAHVDGNHYIRVALRKCFPLPLTHPLWITYRSDIASGWEDKFVSRQNEFREYYYRTPESIQNVGSDGNCGFRAVALGLGLSED